MTTVEESSQSCQSKNSSNPCPLCKESLDNGCEIVKIRQKGADGINTASVQRGDDIHVEVGSQVHLKCRKSYTSQFYIDSHKKKEAVPRLNLKRSSRVLKDTFNSQSDCIFCGTAVSLRGHDFSCVKTFNFVSSIIDTCEKRSDDWALAVKGRIEYYGRDLHAADCIYHHQCSVHFRNGRDFPVRYRSEPSHKSPGRPKDSDQEQAFDKLCIFLEENDEEQITITKLREKMKEYLSRSESVPYTNIHLKKRLIEHYGDAIYVVDTEGLSNVITFKEKTSAILQTYYKASQQQDDEEAQKRAIIETAARLIKSDIKSNVLSATDSYPKSEELDLEAAVKYLPGSLHDILNQLFVGKNKQRKVAAIGQAIIQAVRPRAIIAPLQLGLAVQVHHLLRSKFLVETLYSMGNSSSYSEVLRFEKNAANCVSPDLLLEEHDVPNRSVLFACDNVDHNTITIDGKGTFHGMGMIAALTPKGKSSHLVTRQMIAELNVSRMSKIDIRECKFTKHVLQNIKFQNLPPMQQVDRQIDILWELSFSFKQAVPNWQGLMSLVHQRQKHHGESSIVYLPMIDMYPGDRSCILSCLEYITSLSTRHNIHPVVTFDQPLYWKASAFIHAAPERSPLKGIVLRLGTFHMFMNLLGAIGTLMAGSGLKNILELVYGENAVVHMFSGKAVQRAFRGHLLVDKCLHQMIVKAAVEDHPDLANHITEVEKLYSSILQGDITVDELKGSQSYNKTICELGKKRSELISQSKTSKLWIGYQKMLATARELIKADRTGSWNDHLCAVVSALPVFAAAGHFNYLKSAYLYSQDLAQLEKKNSDVYKQFQDGLHVIRRTNKFWAGLSCDLVIEQTLMKSLKSTGGLTHGSTMSEEQRALWTMSAPITSEINIAMQGFCDIDFSTSQQHKETTDARIERDISDLIKIQEKLASCSPFTPDPALRNIVNGIVASDNTDVHEYKSIGNRIVEEMVGKSVYSLSIKRKEKVRTLASSTAVHVAQDRAIDPSLLFQRFLVVSRTGDLAFEEIMKYELSPYPPSLFEDLNILRKADKPQLAEAISDYCRKTGPQVNMSQTIPQTEKYVLDGGSLLHKLKWRKGDTYGSIAKGYADLTTHRYGRATVVFDGYGTGPTIKDNTHKRRGQKNAFRTVNFNHDTVFEGKKEDFLAIPSNKQHLITLISEKLQEVGCNTVQSRDDADVDITKTAVESAILHSTTLIGEDTDLLIVLLHYCREDGKLLYFRSDNSSKVHLKIYDIKLMKQCLGKRICTQLLFLHSFTGCDSTSRVYGIGKRSVFQRLVKGDEVLQQCADTFTTEDLEQTTVEEVGRQAMLAAFGGHLASSLAALRYTQFTRKIVSAKSFVTPERLPPTESATKFHNLRVYPQVMVWMDLHSDLDPLLWGWKLEDSCYVPVMSSLNPAPNSLMKIVHCNCTTGCSSARCSCRKNGLQCTSACGLCQVTCCDNPVSAFECSEDNDDDSEEEEDKGSDENI